MQWRSCWQFQRVSCKGSLENRRTAGTRMWCPKGTTLKVIRTATSEVSQFVFPGLWSDTFLIRQCIYQLETSYVSRWWDTCNLWKWALHRCKMWTAMLCQSYNTPLTHNINIITFKRNLLSASPPKMRSSLIIPARSPAPLGPKIASSELSTFSLAQMRQHPHSAHPESPSPQPHSLAKIMHCLL